MVGYFIVGLTVGADVPASWTLITETAPAKLRGRLAGLAQVLWYVGAIAPLVLGIALLSLGDWMPRILFAQLFVMYGVWNLVAGTYGFFFPYILEAVGNTSDRANYTLQAIWSLSTALAVGMVYLPLIDRVGGRRLLVWATILQVAGFVPFVLFDVSFLTALINVVLFGIGAGIGQQSLFQLWSGELFPTLLRSTAQGSMFGVVRVALGGWSPAAADGPAGRLPHARDRAGRGC